MNKKIVIGINPFLVTFRCNLECRLCSTGTPYKKTRRDLSFLQMKQIVDRQYRIADYIHKFSLGGGEPTLNKDLPKFIDYLMNNYRERFEIVEILTNGVNKFDNTLLETAEKYKESVFILVDDYGDISKNAAANYEELEKRGIPNHLRCYHGEDAYCGGWLNQGDYSHKFDKEQARENIYHCISAAKPKNKHGVDKEKWVEDQDFFIRYVCTVDGKFTRCARAISTCEAGVIENSPESFVDLLDLSKSDDTLKQELINIFRTDYYKACEYCNGYSSDGQRFPPAEQLTPEELSQIKNGTYIRR